MSNAQNVDGKELIKHIVSDYWITPELTIFMTVCGKSIISKEERYDEVTFNESEVTCDECDFIDSLKKFMRKNRMGKYKEN